MVIPNDVVSPVYCGPPVRKSSDVNHAAVKANLKEFPGLPVILVFADRERRLACRHRYGA
jgi:hypothetical protein